MLDDPEPSIRQTITNRLIEIGEAAVPQLDEHRVKTSDPSLRNQVQSIIRSATFGSYQEEVAVLAGQGIHTMEELEDAVFLFSRFQNPTLRIRPFRELLDALAHEAAVPIKKADTAEAQMLAFTRFLFVENDFRGCTEDFLHPRHSYLHEVLQHRRGIPLSLAFVMLFLADRLKLPFYGMNIPLHFLVKFVTPSNQSILVDPFNQGSIISREQCDRFLANNGIRRFPEYYEAASPYSMFTRFVRNLINGHMESSEPELARSLQELLMLVESAHTDRQ